MGTADWKGAHSLEVRVDGWKGGAGVAVWPRSQQKNRVLKFAWWHNNNNNNNGDEEN